METNGTSDRPRGGTQQHRVPGDLTLYLPDGSPIEMVAALTTDFLVVQLVRYFGCLPCQEWLIELDQAGARFAGSGAAVAAVGGSADYQARWLQEERGVSMPIYLDPEQQFRAAVGAQKKIGLGLLNPKGAAAYTRSLRHGFRPQGITKDTVQTPGVVVLDRVGNVCWSYIGTRIGDYPPISVVERAVADLAAKA